MRLCGELLSENRTMIRAHVIALAAFTAFVNMMAPPQNSESEYKIGQESQPLARVIVH
jgi:hypothetical protein